MQASVALERSISADKPKTVVSDEVRSAAEQLRIANQLEQFRALAQRLFPGPLSVGVQHDPEIPALMQIEFRVETDASPQDVELRYDEWLRCTQDAAQEEAGAITLTILPRRDVIE